eukprot:126070_1
MSTFENKELHIMNNEIMKLCPHDFNAIKKDYKLINSQLTSSYFSPTLYVNKSIRTELLSFDRLSEMSLKIITEELKCLGVSDSIQETIRETMQDKIEIVNITKESDTDLTERFYCELNGNKGQNSFVGIIVFGFVVAENKDEVKLVSCGHCETWKPSFFEHLEIKKIKQNSVKNYILHQLFEQVDLVVKHGSVSNYLKYSIPNHLKIYEKLLSMGFDDKESFDASQLYPDDIDEAVNHIMSTTTKNNCNESNKTEQKEQPKSNTYSFCLIQ